MKNITPLGKAIEHYQAIEAISCYRISALTSITQATLSRLKSGQTNPSLYTLERIAKALNVELSEIIKLKEQFESK